MSETTFNTPEKLTDAPDRSRALPVQEIIRLIYRLADSRTDDELRSRIIKAAGCPAELFTMRPYEISRYLRTHTKAAALFLMILELSACRICDYYSLPTRVTSFRETARLFLRHYLCRPYEQFTAIACDKRLRISADIFVSSKGSPLSADIPLNEIIRYAINSGASHIILAHNHPVSLPSPSHEDILATAHISQVLSELDIRLADHIIISGTQAFSMRLSGEYTDIFGTDRSYKTKEEHICSFSSCQAELSRNTATNHPNYATGGSNNV